MTTVVATALPLAAVSVVVTDAVTVGIDVAGTIGGG